MDPVSSLSSVVTSTIKIAEKGFEICAVDTQAQAVLKTVNQVSGQLRDAKILRRQRSSLFTPFEKRMFDDTFHHTDEAIREVAGLAERARADMQIAGERIRISTRLLFVLRDSPNIHVSLTKLGIASQSLNATIISLMGRQGRPTDLPSGPAPREVKPLFSADLRPPPTYRESMLLSAQRRTKMRRRASAMSIDEQTLSDKSSVREYYAAPKFALQRDVPRDPFTCDIAKTVTQNYIADDSSSEELDYDSFSQVSCFSPPSTFGPAPRLRVPSEQPLSRPRKANPADVLPQITVQTPKPHPSISELDSRDPSILQRNCTSSMSAPPTIYAELPPDFSAVDDKRRDFLLAQAQPRSMSDEMWMDLGPAKAIERRDGESGNVLFSPGPEVKGEGYGYGGAAYVPFRSKDLRVEGAGG